MNRFRNLREKTMSPEPGNGGSGAASLFTKLTQRYSLTSKKFILRKSPGRGHASALPLSGIYNMTGTDSDDLKREIGAPILIATTAIDTDAIDVGSGASVGLGGAQFTAKRSPVSSSSDSEADVFADASSHHTPVENIIFTFLPAHGSVGPDSSLADMITPQLQSSLPPPLPTVPPPPLQPIPNIRKNRSRSACNLHKTELTVYLHRTPSLENQITNCRDNALLRPMHALTLATAIETENQDSSGRSTPTVQFNEPIGVWSAMPSLSHRSNRSRRSSCSFSDTDLDELDNFDMKSVSCNSLTAHNLFLSIDELNAITRQINESEDFNQTIADEYVEHREQLKPSERRITLLRNKNQPLINFGEKKEKISHVWSGLRHWIGEERSKLKEAVQKHAPRHMSVGRRHATSVRNSDCEDTCSVSSRDTRREDTVSLRSNRTSEPNTMASTSGQRDAQTLRGTGETAEGQNGFEELRRYIKQGGDFGKDLMIILQERVEAEQLYAKSLSKLASKLNKACREIPGSLADAWRGVATEMESRGDVHRQFSNSVTEEIVKPLKTILENQHKARKSIESNVDKSARILTDWRISEAKAKKISHTAARENEKLQDAMLDVRITRSTSMAVLHHGTSTHALGRSPEKEGKSTDKDCSKLDNKRRKAEDAMKRADVEYYTLCVRSERARVDWEISVVRGSSVLQSLEEQRLTHLKTYVSSYLKLTNDMNPTTVRIVDRLNPQVSACNVQKDMGVIRNIRRASDGPSEQLLPDFYCEHTTLAMNRERRKQALIKLLQLVQQDLERERRSRNGVKVLSQTLSSGDNQNITDKLYHIRSMLTYLEGSRYKLQSALFELDHKPRGAHPLSPHIQITRDRTGLQQSVLKVPIWLIEAGEEQPLDDRAHLVLDAECVDSKNEVLIKNLTHPFSRSKSAIEINSDKAQFTKTTVQNKTNTLSDKSGGSPTWDRGIADGLSNQQDSDFDEFSSQDEDDDSPKDERGAIPIVIGQCKALYSYTPKLYDELELTPGDIIEIHTKQEDGWWLGALNNRIGIFPATYVEELV